MDGEFYFRSYGEKDLMVVSLPGALLGVQNIWGFSPADSVPSVTLKKWSDYWLL